MVALRARKYEQGKAQTQDELVKLAMDRGYKNPYGWANIILHARESKRAKYAQRQAV